jgi:molybdopterin molybdotransferase
MDGYAVNTEDLGAAPLAVVAHIAAGDAAPVLARGTTAPIMTGAPIPAGANTVVPVEAAVPDRFPTEAETGDGFRIQLPAGAEPGAYIRATGSDIAAGEPVLAARTLLGPTSMGLLAGLGVGEVSVLRRAEVLLLSTGDELVAPGGELGPGQIHDANTTMLAASLQAAGCLVRTVGVLDDSPASFTASLGQALDADGHGYRLVLSSGGISKGAFDVVKEVLCDHGISFGSVAMQPGGPQGAGVLGLPGHDPVAFIAFPGNPVSAFVSFEMFLRPALAEHLGLPDRPILQATLTEPVTSMPGKLQVRRGTYTEGCFTPLGGASSHLLAALAASNALILIEEQTTELAAGDTVKTLLMGDGS